MMVSETEIILFQRAGFIPITGLMPLAQFQKIHNQSPLVSAYLEYELVCFHLHFRLTILNSGRAGTST
jgi:hypothetical protein